MMNRIIRTKYKQDRLNQISNNTKRFKYNFIHRLSRYNNKNFIELKNTCKKIKGVIKLRIDKYDFKAASNATVMWLMNAFVEGLVVNFIVWRLWDLEFGFLTIMAWGCLMKYSLDMYWRLRINGTTTTIPEKYKQFSE